MTSASKSFAATRSTVVSTATGPWPFFPVTGWSSRPATVTVASSSRSRYSGYSSSMSSKSSAASRRTARCASAMIGPYARGRAGGRYRGVMTEQDPDQPAEEFHRRREHPGKLERLDDDQLARLTEEER